MLRKISGFDNYHRCALCKHWCGKRDYSKGALYQGVSFDTNDVAKCDIGGTLSSHLGMMRADEFCSNWDFFGDYI